jgi:drug/metabolite transporter (DMT)-like permease
MSDPANNNNLLNGTPVREKTTGVPLNIKVILAFSAIYVIWGTTYLAIRFVIETMPPFCMMGCRFLTAGAILYMWARFKGNPQPRPEQWRTAAIFGTLLFFGGHGALTWSQQVLPSGVAALLVATAPIWMTLIAYFRNPVNGIPGRVILGLILGVSALVFLVEPTDLIGGQPVNIAGVSVLLIGTLSWCYGSVYSKYAGLPQNPLLASGMTMICGGALLALTGILTGETNRPFAVSGLSLLSLLYLILFGSIIAFTSYIWLLKKVSPAQVSTYAFVNPIIAVFVGWLAGGEALSVKILLASALMMAGVMAIVLRKPKKPRQPQSHVGSWKKTGLYEK